MSYGHPFIDYYYEDKGHYIKASESKHPYSDDELYIDEDDDFLIGLSGGLLMNFKFKFINTHLFRNAAITYERTGKYCQFPKDSIEWTNWWDKEKHRRIAGMTAPCGLLSDGTIIDIRITGDHYAYLNYGRINRAPTDAEWAIQKAKGYKKPKDEVGPPRFWDADYWDFKIAEFCDLNSLNRCTGKSRRKGYSFKRSNRIANRANLYKESNTTLVAADYKYLTGKNALGGMVKRNLDWFETDTDWAKGYLSEDIKDLQLGYKKQTEGNKKFGNQSTIRCVSTAVNESAAIGGKGDIYFEEAGYFDNLNSVLGVTLSNTESGDRSVGTIEVWGTAGVAEANWVDFSNTFYCPDLSNRMIQLENVWDDNARHTTCGFFHSNFWSMEDEKYITMDIDGNSNLIISYEKDKKSKLSAKLNKSLSEYIIFCGQRANSPSEAFSTGVDNLFYTPELEEHITNIEHDPNYKYYVDGVLFDDPIKGVIFKSHRTLEMDNQHDLIHPYIMDVPHKSTTDVKGCTRIYHFPFKIDGIVPDNLYNIVIDSVGKDKNTKEVSIKNSLCSIQVWMNTNMIVPMKGERLVACFVGRNNTMEDDDAIALKLAKLYNTRKGVLPEVNRGETVSNFRKWKSLEYLMKEPTIVWNTKTTNKESDTYGMTINESEKSEGLKYLRDWLYDVVCVTEDGRRILNLHYIDDLPFLKELKMYSNKGNFDRVSTAIIRMFARKYYILKNIQPNTPNSRESILESIGLYSKS